MLGALNYFHLMRETVMFRLWFSQMSVVDKDH